MRILPLAAAASLVLLSTGAQARQAQTPEDLGCVYDLNDVPAGMPRFANYPAQVEPRRKPAPANIRTDPGAPMFQTRIREGAKRGPNFAGHYTIVWWGAGFAGQMFAIIDSRTGKIAFSHLPAIYFGHYGHIEIERNAVGWPRYSIGAERWPPRNWDGPRVGEWGSLYWRMDSRLIVIAGMLNEEAATDGIHYLVWDGQRLKEVRFVKAPCRASIPR